MKPVAVFPMNDPTGILFPHLERIAPLLKEIFARAFVSVTAVTQKVVPDYMVWLKSDNFFQAIYHEVECTVGEDFLTLYAEAASACEPEQIMHLCFIDRLAFALQSNHQAAFIQDIRQVRPEDTPLIFQRSEAAIEENYFMAKVKSYHRPESVEEALGLLQRPSSTLLAGGTQLIARLDEPVDVIDLQAVGLNQIEVAAETITIGAMVRLQAVVEHEAVPELVRQMTLREGPNTFRHMGTLGGVVATADPESELYAALLVHEAVVTVQTNAGEARVPLAEFELGEKVLITAVTLHRHGQTASDRVARTPADRPIVAVVGRHVGETVALAGCGVAERPILINANEIDQLTPPADFRGSSRYRREMTAVLSQRVLAEMNGTQRREDAKKEF